MNSPEADLICILIGVTLFVFGNPDRKFLFPIAALTVTLIGSEMIYYLDFLTSQIIWGVSTTGLIICYAIRLMGKSHFRVMEYFKIIGVILLVIYPVPFYSVVPVGESHFWFVIRALTFFVLATIYVYDRLILKPEVMKKKFMVVLISQTVVMLLLLMYAFVQKRLRQMHSERKH